MSKIIVSDCDGVLLNWEYAFDVWMNDRDLYKVCNNQYEIELRYGITTEEAVQLVREFNSSAAIGFLPPLRDAVYYVERLYKLHGYVFDVVTALGTDVYARKLRERNLRKVFGAAIRHVTCLDLRTNKRDVLKRYENTGVYWFEDKPALAVEGQELGLTPIVMEHEHNMDIIPEGIPVVRNWESFYKIATGE